MTEHIRPNPYLETPLRDITVNKNLSLTKISPAFMTRQVSEMAMKRDGAKFRITSLNPIRPENRHSFSERLLTEFNRCLRGRYPLSIIMGDIDNFKLYNDTYGHAGGDGCLRSVAQTIDKTLKRPVDFCARYGGEEFIIILPATDRIGAMKIAEEIRANVHRLNIAHEKSLPEQVVTISLGVTTRESEAMLSHEELLRMADDALYKAKGNGRNRVEFFCEEGRSESPA